MKYYVLQVHGDVEPELHGPYSSDEERDEVAVEIRKETCGEDGIFMMDVDENAVPSVDSYSSAFFEEALGEDYVECC